MKYPQLVSPRAVNAISDWLVSRLEQLGVESPQIYTRLLLSLLQSSVQVNDPIEFSNLEAFFANRKGGHKRFQLPSDTETLKKLNAVQCLREIVSNEQETATIENLVEELCEKLKNIEKQTQNLRDEESFLIEIDLDTDSLIQNQNETHTQLQNQQQPTSSNNNLDNHTHNHHNHQQQPHQITHNIYHNSNSTAFNTDTKRHHVLGTTTTSSSALNDLDNDPKNRYFRAFPALSKEMEDSFRIWRRNAKSLTWPVVGRSIVVDNLNNSSASLSSSSASSIISSSNIGANSVSTDKIAEKKLKGAVSHQSENKRNTDISGSNCSGNIDCSDIKQYQGAAASIVKKKSKRRRNQALSKGKTVQNIRKLSVVTASNTVGVNKFHHYTHHRNSSPAWDTDFKGCWEMGPDLIKEFLSRQNGNKRNRSNSDTMDHEVQNEDTNINKTPLKNHEKPIMRSYIDLSFCCDDDNDDEINNHADQTQHHYIKELINYVDEDYDINSLASVSELTMDNFNPKRLYQREGHTQKPLLAFNSAVLDGNNAGDYYLEETTDLVDSLDFQQFKAKFNSNVEALWKNVEPEPISSQQPTAQAQITDISLKIPGPLDGGISSAFYASTSLNALAPFKKDLWNFWSNFQQHYDQINNKLPTTAETSNMTTTTRLDDSSASPGAGADIANSIDYFSMPSNLDNFDKSVGGVRRINEAGASLGAHTPSINLFLKNSIWSASGDCVDDLGTTSVSTTADADESFLFKVWHSNKKLSELDVGNAVSGEKVHVIEADDDGVSNSGNNNSKEFSSSLMVNNPNLSANLQFPPYRNLKWSEGINAGPPYGSLCTNDNVSHHIEMQPLSNNSSLRADNDYASFNTVSSISGTTWKAPAYGQNVQPDLKSWCASNPMSLTEMYGNDVCDSIVNQPAEEEHELNESEIITGPVVTLPNHCASTSGFVAYSRIKQYNKVQSQIKPVETANSARLPKDFFRNSEEENLLTSELTHFHPIENFVDGHTFDICNALDTVEFERTSSGLMRYDSEEYLEYTRSDIYMADEEVATNSTNFFKYGRKDANEDKSVDTFVIKFRVQRAGEIACQTEELDLQLSAAKMCTDLKDFPTSLEMNKMFHNTFSLSRQANNEAIIAAVSKAVAAAAKAAAENHVNDDRFCWIPISNMNTIATAGDTCSNSYENNPLWRPDNSICDEVDFCIIDSSTRRKQQQQLAQNWSMLEVEKQCHQRSCLSRQQQQKITTKFPSISDLERNDENSLDNTSLHTLWGMCAVCNNCENSKSKPANSLLRDELQLEADEIMSDLRYMQDLYIGESDIQSDPNDANTTEETDLSAGDKMFDYIKNKIDVNSIKNTRNTDRKENKKQQCDLAQVSMLQKVNQLIEDLLRPENRVKLPKESAEYEEISRQTQLSNVWHLQHSSDQERTKNLWQFAEEKDNIWQHKPLLEQFEHETNENVDAIVKPMKLLKQVGGSVEEDTQYRETLNWKHDHLAKIWQKYVPTSTQMEETLIKSNTDEMATNIFNENLLKDQEKDSECRQMVVDEKNLKNLQNSGALTPPSSSLPNNNTYKRVHQFLNNSVAKMKLAANRKRRHSASQNFSQQQHLQYNNNGINNNDNNITDLNAYKEKLNSSLKAAKDREVTPFNDNPLTSNMNSGEQPTKQTIITCKYWTTATNGTQSSLDSAAAAMMLLAAATNANNANDMLTAATTDNYQQEDVMLDENIFGNTFSCLIDKNASILNHVTMMTRPLTR